MQIVRTAVWILITIIVVAFIAMNWVKVPVRFWPLETDYLQFEWPVGFVALVFFALGLGPMWLLHRAGQWRLQRRITSLENSARAAAIAAPLATSTQLEEAAPTDTSPEQDKAP